MLKSVFLGAAALCFAATPLMAQGASSSPATGSVPETRRAVVSDFVDQADRPTSPIKVVIPASNPGDLLPISMPGEEMDGTEVPEEIGSEPPTETGLPTFFGSPVSGRFVWCLDRSGSMATCDPEAGPLEDRYGNTIAQPTRWQRVRAEVAGVLRELSPDDEFAIVSFGH